MQPVPVEQVMDGKSWQVLGVVWWGPAGTCMWTLPWMLLEGPGEAPAVAAATPSAAGAASGVTTTLTHTVL